MSNPNPLDFYQEMDDPVDTVLPSRLPKTFFVVSTRGGKAHRDGIARDGRFGSRASGRAEGVVGQPVEEDLRGFLLHTFPVGILDLSEDPGYLMTMESRLKDSRKS